MRIPLAVSVTLLWVGVASAPATTASDRYCGEYRLPSGNLVSILKEGVIREMTRLVLTNWETGRVSKLEPAGDDRLVVRSPAGDTRKPEIEITFDTDESGHVTCLYLQASDGSPVRAERVSTVQEEPVVFVNGGVRLSGTFKRPMGKGPFPAVVLVHGSGPGGREQLESMARFFVHLGIASLTYDKRGCGESGGDWKTVDLEVLADDALAGIALLQSRRDIDPGRIGLWGISQGGWIVPLAAARSAAVAFAINHSGPGTTLRRQDTFMTENLLRMQEVPQADIELAIAALNTLYDYGQRKSPAAVLDAAVERLRGKPGLEDFETLSSRNLVPDSMYAAQPIGDPAWFFHLDPDRDALRPYRSLTCPILVVYGKLDYTVPVAESVRNIERALAERSHPDYAIEVLPRTGHGMLVMQPDSPQRPAEPLTLALEYYAIIENWLFERGFCPARVSH